MFIENVVFTIFLFLTRLATFESSSYIWKATEEWTTCSKSCDQGIESQIFVCLKRTSYRTLEYTENSECSVKRKPNNTRKCSFGECKPTSEGAFVWQVGNWSVCPKKCGGSALQNREVNCFLMTSKGQFLLAKLSQCNYLLEPPRFISCAKADCPPNFMTSRWKKCPEVDDCRPTVRRRDVQCLSLLGTGKLKIQPRGVCFRMKHHPPSSWQFCNSYMSPHCLEIKKANKKQNNKIVIKTEISEIYQMRHTKRLKVFVGQIAHVFGFTRLSIFCPVEKHHKNLIKWEHDKKIYEYKGFSKERVKVNRKGALIIREFYLADVGIWTCKAGKFTADAILQLEQPSSGFDNWLKRHANHNYGMLNEESNISFIRPESLLWMKSEWSPCSVTCNNNKDNPGYQTRRVTCEKIETQYYKIIDDKYCPPTKPISQKKCKLIQQCPQWKVENKEKHECSEDCINIGLAKTSSNIICQYNNRTVDSSICDSKTLPNITCPNSKCQISYHYGPWSQCSLSCSNNTDTSIRSRTMQCVWKHTLEPAFQLCQLNKLTNLRLTKSCRVPKCILGCKDLSEFCVSQPKYRCRNSLFYHYCCAFCKKQYS